MTATDSPASPSSNRSTDGLPFLRALSQKPSQVVVRDPGQRFLSAPRPIARYATEHWEFAWLSVAAYGKTLAGHKRAAKDRRSSNDPAHPGRSPGHATHEDPEAVLRQAGSECWLDFPDAKLKQAIEASHLRVEVWERKRDAAREGSGPSAVAVRFGGTIFGNEMDCRANLRWFLPGSDDEYSQVVKSFAPAFVAEFIRRSTAEGGGHLQDAQLFATGHSLGGGLAQQFAYSLPLHQSVPRVRKVYAFDPSPVTGFYSVPVRLRNEDKKDLYLDRIYERGEILALARSITSLFHKPSARHAVIRGARYCLFYSMNPIADHSIFKLATKLAAARCRSGESAIDREASP